MTLLRPSSLLRTSTRLLGGPALAVLAVGGHAAPAAGVPTAPAAPRPPSAPPPVDAAALPSLSQPADPLLWRGVFRNRDGAPAAAPLQVYARASAARLAALADPSTGMRLLGTATSAADGTFEIRLPWRDELAGLVDDAGNVTFLVVGGGVGELTMANATMTWLPAANRWAPAAAAGAAASRAGVAGPAQLGVAQLDAASRATSNPSLDGTTLDLRAAPAPVPTSAPGVDVAYPTGTGQCNLQGIHMLAPSKHVIGRTDIDKANYWSTKFTYKATGSTSNGVGMTVAGGPFQYAGSTTVESNVEAGGETTTTPSPDHITARKHWIKTYTYKNIFKCWTNPNSPPTGNPNAWPTVVTVEKGAWYSDFSLDDVSGYGVLPACTLGPGHDFSLGPTSWTYRSSGTSQMYENAFEISVPEAPDTFKGSAVITNNAAAGTTVTSYFANTHATANKHLCGTTANPITGNTWVVATSVWNA